MSVPGIDYGAGKTNIDFTNNIRYGVISQHDVLQAWADSSEAVYGDPHCPKCGNEPNKVEDLDEENMEQFEFSKGSTGEFACTHCRYIFDSDEAYGDEPIGFTYDDDGYIAHSCLDNDIIIVKSPFYTKACFCSPCVPGAGNLNSTDEGGVKTYCFGHDWFEDGKSPYPVYRVDNDELVHPA